MEKTGQWNRVRELFDAALERKPGERDSFLRQVCGRDTWLRSEVESLLSAYKRSDGFSQAPFPIEVSREVEELESIGPYRLIRKIGEGGMGQVWLAEQTEPLQRHVALKLIRAGVCDDALLRRFQAERQSLALMEHPAIAKVFDAGATQEGQPYLVMEYVPGEPITKYADRRKLSIRQRLDLFAKACDGVQHAHQKAILHRDLKPANILVLDVDGQPTPRIIDFGLARAFEAEPDSPESPRAELMAGTPGYMSPEQAAGGDVDTRTDVYSLGVVLYEILTGQLPFDAKRGAAGILRQMQERPIAKPSERVAGDSERTREAAEYRRLKPRRLAAELHGELDLIAARALEKDRAQRYGSPSELAADVRRWLRHEPVEAHPPSAAYQVRKYVRRHRVGAAMTALLALLLIGFAALQAFELRRVARERDRVARIAGFMTNMFRVSDPGEARGNQITAREILDQASTQIESGLAGDPETQTQLMMTMGAVYENLGLYQRAESLYGQAATIRERQLGPGNEGTLTAQGSLAWALYRRGQFHDAENLLRQVLTLRLRKFGPNSNATVTVMDHLGTVLNEEGHSAESEALVRRALDYRSRVLGNDNPDTLVTINNLALTMQSEGRWAEAEALNRKQLAGWQQLQGADSPRVLQAQGNLAIILYREGRLAEAEALDRQNLAGKRHILGPEHPETVRAMNTLMATLTDEGKLDEAQALEEQVVAIRTRVLGPDHPLTLSAMGNLANILARKGDYARARQLQEQAHAGELRVLGPDHPATALSTYNLAALAAHQGQKDEAFRLLRESVDHGLANWVIAGMATDPDLVNLHGDPRFNELVAFATARAKTK